MMQPGTDRPRHANKSDTIRETQIALLDASIVGTRAVAQTPFLLEGHTPSFYGRVLVAIDGMNGVHSKLNVSYSLTIGMHVESIARRILKHAFSVASPGAKVVDVHFDDPSFVPEAKLLEHLG
eukprot:IDg4753t1